MDLVIHKDYHSLSLQAANEIIQLVKIRPNAVICLPSGDTPRLTCQLFVEMAQKDNVDFGRIVFIGLDEWVGIAPENIGSCHYFFKSNVFVPLKIKNENIFLFDGMSTDLEKECERMDNVIFGLGGIDLMLVGIGMNGHIGFNEPGTPFDKYSHVINLDEITSVTGQKYFEQLTTTNKGITLGLKHLMESKRVLLLANGNKKAPIIKRMLEEEISNALPASMVRTHSNAATLVDEEAASLLKK